MIPRPEYPRPQFTRAQWQNLNGPWAFEIDSGNTGLERGLLKRDLSGSITVPFCPESTLSGVGNVDFMPAVWYQRSFAVPESWRGQQLLLHFGAVDYDATVWVNGIEVGRHRGGFTPFTCPLTNLATGGEEIDIRVRARDDNANPQPRGKQTRSYGNHDCMYTRTTGIWQTVWIEPVGASYLTRPRLTPEVGLSRFRLEQGVVNAASGQKVRASLYSGEEKICTREALLGQDMTARLDLDIPEEKRVLWEPGQPYLYDIQLELLGPDGAVLDSAQSYAGLRSVAIRGKAVLLNGKPFFQKLVLDQGFYPDGIMTAPSDEDLRRDIELGQQAGFNGARLHQKLFEERFLYHADQMGYLCWGEFGDWGCRPQAADPSQRQFNITYAAQWAQALERDYSHPCIVGWCPLNETFEDITDQTSNLDDATQALYAMTKLADSTRPVLDTSGYSHRVPYADIFDCHDYEQDPAVFEKNHAGLAQGKPHVNGSAQHVVSVPYQGQPYMVSEFGGIQWVKVVAGKEDATVWGYGKAPETLEEFFKRFEALTAILLDNPDMFGYCYTQLTDVFQEQNGIYAFDRSQKFPLERIRTAQRRLIH